MAPDISGATLTGQHLDTSRWRGHAIVVNFWGSWCVPCREEAPVLVRVARDTRFGAAAPVTTPSTYIIDARGRIAWPGSARPATASSTSR
jgi:thiol-disulfide isomerase/thioredoxin